MTESYHWANIGGSTSAQYPTDLHGGVTTTAGSANFIVGPGMIGKQVLLVGLILSGRDSAATSTIAIKDHAATATYLTLTVAGGVTPHSQYVPCNIKIPVGGIQSVCSDTDVAATLLFAEAGIV